jgi:ORF6N domain
MPQTLRPAPATQLIVPVPFVERRIHRIRGLNVLLDRDLAELYGVKATALRQQVKRNRRRFPADFMFQLTAKEADVLVSQSVIPSRRSLGGFLPYVFTQEGVAMLSSVLSSARAVQVNIAIMRAFVQLRQFVAGHTDLAKKIGALERKYSEHDGEIQVIFEAIKKLLAPPEKPRRPIGFKPGQAGHSPASG